MQEYHGVFTTPEMRSILNQMQKIHEAAEARYSNHYPFESDPWRYPDYPEYTEAELKELRNLRHEYNAAKAAAGL